MCIVNRSKVKCKISVNYFFKAVLMILGGGEYSTTRGTTEQNPAGAVHQAAGAGGVASGDGGVTDRLPRGSPHP